jgi:uncharacterized protein (DUF58 family)
MKPANSLPLERDFLARLAAARALAFAFFRGIIPQTAISGPPTEFDGHRPYVPGDDIRWIDWNLFARLEDLYVKVFQVEEEVEVYLFVDASSSMTAGEGAKYGLASASAAALSYLALLTSHPVTVVRYAERVMDMAGPVRSADSYSRLNDLLAGPVSGTGTELYGALSTVLGRGDRPVSVVVLSDGFQREPLERAISLFGDARKRRFVFLQVEDSRELRPRLSGNIVLGDRESGDGRTFLSDRRFEKQVHGRIAKYFDRLRASLNSLGAEHFSLPVEASVEESLFTMLLKFQPEGAGVVAR